MAIRNEFEAKNNLIRSGTVNPQADINQEIYNNIEVLSNTQQARSNDVNNLNARIDQSNFTISEAIKKIDNANGAIFNQTNLINEHSSKLDYLDNKIKNFNIESLKGLSRHFNKQHTEMMAESDKWLARLMQRGYIGIAGWGLVISTLIACVILKIEGYKFLYLLIPYNIVYFSLLYFTVSQYSHYKRLGLDAKNREVVAESYLGILDNSTDAEQKSIITKIVAETLFSRNIFENGAELPLKEILKIVGKSSRD